ncbi:MAG: hypothetical protein EA392_08670 [Cryomorphaceae bacterium]|nr:MAG: hypothetical protein EA392_08670 [Cryomorphaceae bacterium]
MTVKERIEKVLEGKACGVYEPNSIVEIDAECYVVYVLAHNNEPLLVGQGKRNRAKIIFDDLDAGTTSHFKALKVRLYHLYHNEIFPQSYFQRVIVKCKDREESKQIEKLLHREMGGNNNDVPCEIKTKLLDGLSPDSVPFLLLEIALISSFGGISDIIKWRKKGLLKDEVWTELSTRLRLDKLGLK